MKRLKRRRREEANFKLGPRKREMALKLKNEGKAPFLTKTSIYLSEKALTSSE